MFCFGSMQIYASPIMNPLSEYVKNIFALPSSTSHLFGPLLQITGSFPNDSRIFSTVRAAPTGLYSSSFLSFGMESAEPHSGQYSPSMFSSVMMFEHDLHLTAVF